MKPETKITYFQIPNSKYATIQVQFPTGCQKEDIILLQNIYKRALGTSENPQNMVSAAICALFIELMDAALIMVELLTNNIIDKYFSVFNNTFIYSVSFIPSVKYYKSITEYLATQLHRFTERTYYYRDKPIGEKNYNLDEATINTQIWKRIYPYIPGGTSMKDINTQYLKEFNSTMVQVELAVFDKIEPEKFKNTIGLPIIKKLFDERVSTVYDTKIWTFPEKMVPDRRKVEVTVPWDKYDKYEIPQGYSKFYVHMNQMGAWYGMLLAILNKYKTKYIVRDDYIYLLANNATALKMDLKLQRFLIGRLKFNFNKGVIKHSKSKNAAKIESKRRDLIIQFVAQSAVLPIDKLKDLKTMLNTYSDKGLLEIAEMMSNGLQRMHEYNQDAKAEREKEAKRAAMSQEERDRLDKEAKRQSDQQLRQPIHPSFGNGIIYAQPGKKKVR